MLDVACGPGLLACAFAQEVRSAAGIDVAPAMIDQAGCRQAELGLDNVTWRVGDIRLLPWPDASFDITCRFAVHDFVDPSAVVELLALFDAAAPPEPQRASSLTEAELEAALSRSLPNPGDGDRVRGAVDGTIDDDPLGVPARRSGERGVFGYPISVLTAVRP